MSFGSITPFRRKCAVRPWCFALCLPPRQTAEEQSAAFALISELLDANCLDYGGAVQVCGQEGTTHFYVKFIKLQI